jgi:hypothetical protein
LDFDFGLLGFSAIRTQPFDKRFHPAGAGPGWSLTAKYQLLSFPSQNSLVG